MNKDKLIELVNSGLSQRKISRELTVSESTVRYWLNKYGLKTLNNRYNKFKNLLGDNKRCPKCGEYKPLGDFYIRKDRGFITSYCKKCNSDYHRERLIGIKKKMILYKGGKCMVCDVVFDGDNYAIFDFHHKGKEGKDIKFSGIKHRKWEVIKKEIDKCDLVCSNCHRLIHSHYGDLM